MCLLALSSRESLIHIQILKTLGFVWAATVGGGLQLQRNSSKKI